MSALDPTGPVYLGCPCGRAALCDLFERCLYCQVAEVEREGRPTDRPAPPADVALPSVPTVRLPRPDPWAAFEGALGRVLAAHAGLHAAMHRVPLDRYPEAVVAVLVGMDALA